MRRAEILWAIAVLVVGTCVVGCFGIKSARVAGSPGFPLDDAWIHVRFGQNFAQTGCFAFNPGEPTAGSTSPLWVILLAGGSLISGRSMLHPYEELGEFVVAALFLGVLCYLVWGLCTYGVVRRMFGQTDEESSDPGGSHGPALLAALIVVVNVRVVWGSLSGMEICLAGALALLAVASFAADEVARTSASWRTTGGDAASRSKGSGAPNKKRNVSLAVRIRPFLTPVLFGLASLARPEAHLLFCLAVFLRVARSCRRDTPIRDIVRLIPYRMIAIYVLVTAPWHLFSLWSSGSLLPNTFRANFRGLATRYYPPGFYTIYGRWLFLNDHLWIYWFLPLGVLATVRWTFWSASWRTPDGAATSQAIHESPLRELLSPFAMAVAQLSSLWVIFYPVIARLILPMTRHHERYMIPMTSFHAILAVVGVWALVQTSRRLAGRWRKERREERKPLQPDPNSKLETQNSKPPIRQWGWFAIAMWLAFSVAVVVSAVPGLSRWAAIHGRNVYSINHQHVAMAEWVKGHTAPDAVIATHDIGALGAISQRRIVDLFGLVTPAMIHRVNSVIPTLGSAPGWYLNRIQASGATYLVGYPGWLSFIREAPDCFEAIHHEILDRVDICGGADMVAFRIHRDRLKQTPASQ